MNFKTRSYQAELLDNEDIPIDDLYQNLRELNFINRTLGGHSVVLDGIKYFVNSILNENLRIYEIGSGGGDNLRAVGSFLSRKKISHQLGGVDLKEDCVKFAESYHSNSSKINYQIADYQLATFSDGKPHIIFNSLFCHHFRDEALVTMLQWMHQNSQLGFVIADLHRHQLAYYSIKFLTRIFIKSPRENNRAHA